MLFYILAGLYGTGALGVFRHVAYDWNQEKLKGHEFQSICDFCRCPECGITAHNHKNYRGVYCDAPLHQGWVGMHPMPIFGGIAFSLILWIPTLIVFFGMAGLKKAGLNGNFFAPTPQIMTRDEKRAAKEAKKDEEIKALQKKNEELEKELGIKALPTPQ